MGAGLNIAALIFPPAEPTDDSIYSSVLKIAGIHIFFDFSQTAVAASMTCEILQLISYQQHNAA